MGRNNDYMTANLSDYEYFTKQINCNRFNQKN